jgi:hypothetical protein
MVSESESDTEDVLEWNVDSVLMPGGDGGGDIGGERGCLRLLVGLLLNDEDKPALIAAFKASETKERLPEGSPAELGFFIELGRVCCSCACWTSTIDR